MRNRDIMDEDYGNEIETAQFIPQVQESWAGNILSVVAAACLASVFLALTVRLDQWILHS